MEQVFALTVNRQQVVFIYLNCVWGTFLTYFETSIYHMLQTVGGHCRKSLEKSRRLIKVPPLTAVNDVPGVAALNLISSNRILLSIPAGYLGKGRGGVWLLCLCGCK
jgi:hypothetical protein